MVPGVSAMEEIKRFSTPWRVLHQGTNCEAGLCDSIEKLFGYQLLPPDATGAYIVSEYQASPDGPKFDISSAGSGFQQVLMLLTFLNTRPATVLLLDEPDAHLHVILQDSIYGELRSVAARQGSQLIMATHSEVIINSVEPHELWRILPTLRPLTEDSKKRAGKVAEDSIEYGHHALYRGMG